MEGLCGALRQVQAVFRHGSHALLKFQVLFLTGQLLHQIVVAAHERGSALHHQRHAPVEIRLLAVRVLKALMGLLPQRRRAHFQPSGAVRADVALGVVLLVDLHHFGDLIQLFAVARPQHVLQGFPLPVGLYLLPEAADILLPHLESVLGAGGERFKLPVHPGTSALGKYHPVADSRRPVAHDQLLRLHPNLHLLQRGFQRQRPLDDPGLLLIGLVGLCDNLCLFNGRVPRFGQHPLLQPPDPGGHL